MVRDKYIKSLMARTDLSYNRIFSAICVQAECIPEIQHLCIAGYFDKVVDDKWYLFDLPKDKQQEVADADSPKQKLTELKQTYGDELRRKKPTPLHGVWDGKGEMVWLEAAVVDRLMAMRGPGESYSDVVLRLVKLEAGKRAYAAP